MRRCAECQFASPKIMENTGAGDGRSIPVLECHRFPPPLVAHGAGDVLLVWPQVEADDWCGEFSSDPDPVVEIRRPAPSIEGRPSTSQESQ